jgi:hypothetical protein
MFHPSRSSRPSLSSCTSASRRSARRWSARHRSRRLPCVLPVARSSPGTGIKHGVWVVDCVQDKNGPGTGIDGDERG